MRFGGYPSQGLGFDVHEAGDAAKVLTMQLCRVGEGLKVVWHFIRLSIDHGSDIPNPMSTACSAGRFLSLL
jgi:hypothetical protein